MNMIVGQDDLTRQQEPVALFELGINHSPDGSNGITTVKPVDSVDSKKVSFLKDFLLLG
jgi:hypothetical protein